MTDIKSMTKDELKNLMTELGEKPFRAKQIYSWLHEHLVTSYDEMGNIPGKLKEKLKDYPIAALEMVDEQVSAIDGTRKYLFRLSDGNMIESVLMRYSMEIPSAFLLRQDVAWAAAFVHLRSVV